jgi:hypothetical protein
MLNVDFPAAIVNSPRAVSLSTSGKACLLPRISDHCVRAFVNVTVIGGYAGSGRVSRQEGCPPCLTLPAQLSGVPRKLRKRK